MWDRARCFFWGGMDQSLDPLLGSVKGIVKFVFFMFKSQKKQDLCQSSIRELNWLQKMKKPPCTRKSDSDPSRWTTHFAQRHVWESKHMSPTIPRQQQCLVIFQCFMCQRRGPTVFSGPKKKITAARVPQAA